MMGFRQVSEKYWDALSKDGEKNLVPPIGVKFVHNGEAFPAGEIDDEPIDTPWCGALRLAAEGGAVAMDKNNIGCPAGAISLGLVDQHQKTQLEKERKYTSLMDRPATPEDFTSGFVYACKDSGHMEYALFGESDSGRYKTLGAGRKAVTGMAAIQPPIMRAVICYRADSLDTEPDVVVLAVTPKQALRIVQAHSFETGERVEFSTIGIRGVCADVTAYPFLEQKMNASFFCLGARALAGWKGDLLAMGIPGSSFGRLMEAFDNSKTGFPYDKYPK